MTTSDALARVFDERRSRFVVETLPEVERSSTSASRLMRRVTEAGAQRAARAAGPAFARRLLEVNASRVVPERE